jgi:hypothetical protein
MASWHTRKVGGGGKKWMRLLHRWARKAFAFRQNAKICESEYCTCDIVENWILRKCNRASTYALIPYSHAILQPNPVSPRCKHLPALCCDIGPSCVISPSLQCPTLTGGKWMRKRGGSEADFRKPCTSSGEFLSLFGDKRSRMTTEIEVLYH